MKSRSVIGAGFGGNGSRSVLAVQFPPVAAQRYRRLQPDLEAAGKSLPTVDNNLQSNLSTNLNSA
ncbi:hypothetical protein RvY_12344 [Ramazzottius varieornatus]|uniref:Uncharacterized protein n=1 Tax=Ramazzottius varieornatus TaxID=947166 RepID=A0A1D1VLG8_RAMVA|nr:hypothetical protein RvY_12344 [Ramazzottius varieornatus]